MATTLTRWAPWTPFREIDVFDRRMRKLFEDVGFFPAALPAADVYETDHEWVVEVEVPGFEMTDLKIEAKDRIVTVTGERHEEKEREEKAYRMKERLESHFERCFELPVDVDGKALKATYHKGVLELHAPKLMAPEARTVEITTA